MQTFSVNVSNYFIVCWSFSFRFLCIFYFCKLITFITFLLIDNPQAVAAVIGIAIKAKPMRDNVIKLDVEAMTRSVSNDFIVVVNSLYF